MAWFHCNSVVLHWFKAFFCEFNRLFLRKSMFFLVNTVLGHVSVIANNVFFSEKLAIIHWKNGLVLLQFSGLHRFKAFLCEFNRLFLRKSMFF